MYLEPYNKASAYPLTIYALELNNGKFFLDQTQNLNTSLKKHFRYDNLRQSQPYGRSWTQLWPPVRIHHIYRNSVASDLNKYTLEYMKKYGIENVRGGEYSSTDLSFYQYSELKKIINRRSSIQVLNI